MYDSKISRNTGGMIISHIDCSDNLTFKQTVAKELWKTGTPNKYLSHSCAKWVKVKGNDDYRLNYFQIDDLLLPGANNIQTIQFTPWSGEAMDKKLISITKEGVNIRFRFEGTIITSEKVEISQTSASLQLLNTLQLSAQVFPDKAEDKRIVWSSSNEKIASVDVNGLVTAVSPGVATITALAGDGKSEATCEVTVYAEGSTIIEPAQREVHVSWGGTEEPQTWIVRYKKSADEEFETMEVSGETMCILHYLTPDTEYVLQVCALIGNAESGNVVDATFKTEALNGDFHRIRGIRKDWKEGDRFWPVVDNIHKQVLKTVWKLDDDVFSDKEELVLPGGTHRLQVEVTTADGMTETIVRQIKVESKTEEQ